jgi:hypothetical protein
MSCDLRTAREKRDIESVVVTGVVEEAFLVEELKGKSLALGEVFDRVFKAVS